MYRNIYKLPYLILGVLFATYLLINFTDYFIQPIFCSPEHYIFYLKGGQIFEKYGILGNVLPVCFDLPNTNTLFGKISDYMAENPGYAREGFKYALLKSDVINVLNNPTEFVSAETLNNMINSGNLLRDDVTIKVKVEFIKGVSTPKHINFTYFVPSNR